MKAAAKWDTVRRHLEGASKSVAAEIRGYPAPIPACDAQFNHLLERRRLLTRELARLDAAQRNGTGTPEDFVRASPVLADGAVQALTGADAAA